MRDDLPTGTVTLLFTDVEGSTHCRMKPSTWASGLTLLRATVLTAALLTACQVSNADGASPALAAKSKVAFISARIAPQGTHAVELYVISADGSGKRRLLETARGPAPVPWEPYELSSRPAWSPDGRSIAFVRMGDDGNVDVYVVRADGHGQQRLTRHPAVDGNPAWSPDGRKIAFTRRGAGFQIHTYVMNADGSGKRRLTRNGGIHFSVAWSPDGQKLLFERPNPRHAESAAAAARRDWPEEVYIMNADGSGQRRLTRNPARDLGPVWSPDGRQIAFTREWNTESSRKLYVMNADGSDQRSLTPARSLSSFPAWSPDGRKIAFGGGKPSAYPGGIFVMNADGSEQRRLTQHGSHPAWSPDGKMVAFARDVAGAELHVTNADGSGERRLMRSGVRWIVPYAWSPTLRKGPEGEPGWGRRSGPSRETFPNAGPRRRRLRGSWQDRLEIPDARLGRRESEQDSSLRYARGREPPAVVGAEVPTGDVLAGPGDVALDELGHTANLDSAEGRNRFEHEEGAARVAGEVLELHVTVRDHHFESVLVQPEPDRGDNRATVLTVCRKDSWSTARRSASVSPDPIRRPRQQPTTRSSDIPAHSRM